MVATNLAPSASCDWDGGRLVETEVLCPHCCPDCRTLETLPGSPWRSPVSPGRLSCPWSSQHESPPGGSHCGWSSSSSPPFGRAPWWRDRTWPPPSLSWTRIPSWACPEWSGLGRSHRTSSTVSSKEREKVFGFSKCPTEQKHTSGLTTPLVSGSWKFFRRSKSSLDTRLMLVCLSPLPVSIWTKNGSGVWM